MPLIRYPGAKAKVTKEIMRLFPENAIKRLLGGCRNYEYREPFFGSGAVGFDVLRHVSNSCRVWVNDADSDLICLWKSVKDECESLQKLIRGFTPTTEAFYDFKERDGKDDCDTVERGFRKLVLHRISFSGYGVMAGSPIGGKDQSSKYGVGCRWNPVKLCEETETLSVFMRKFKDFRITSQDFAAIVRSADENCFVYADPPYYEAGTALYKHSFSDFDHERLSDVLYRTESDWLASYDDAPEIRSLYEKFAVFHKVEITYSNAIAKGKRAKTSEIAIVKKPCRKRRNQNVLE